MILNIREKIISSFFENLSNKYEYAILHHVNKIYDNDDDIDFIVNCNRNEMINFIKDFIKDHNVFLGNHYTIDINIYRFDFFYFNNHNLERIELDCVCNGNGRDLLKIDNNILLKNRIAVDINDSIFYKISDIDEIEYYIKKKAYKNSDISLYISYLKKLDSDISEKIIFEKYMYWQKYFSSKEYKIKYVLNKIILLIERMIEKPSFSISFLGPDGSGKSTIISKIKEIPLFINNYYFHLKPLYSREKLIIVEEPHKYPPYSKLKSYIKLLYFIYQYNCGWLKNIMPLKIKSSLVIFDRYYDDMLVDTKRYRYGGSVRLAKFARLFISKPDIYFILTTDPKVIYERKQEVPFKELERQVKEYRALADGKRYFNIDVNRSPEDIAQEIMDIIMGKMNERY